MTWAVNHPNRRQRVGSGTWTSARTTTRPVRVPWVGLFIALLGAWGGIVAFIGPLFGYHATTTSSWQWTTTNWLLHLVPGAMALVAGLSILGWTTRWASFKARGALAFAALLAIVAGAWFVIGPALWPWFESSAAYGPATDAQTSFVNQVGANLGPGVLLAMLGGMALKTAMSAPRMVSAEEPVAGEPVADAEPRAAGGYDSGYASHAGPGPAAAGDPAAERTGTEPGVMSDPTATTAAERDPGAERGFGTDAARTDPDLPPA